MVSGEVFLVMFRSVFDSDIDEGLPKLRSPKVPRDTQVPEEHNEDKVIPVSRPTVSFRVDGDRMLRHVGSSNSSESNGGHVLRINSSDWIFTQVTAVCSVATKGYLITPDTVKYINANGCAFTNEDLLRYHRTFVGGHNYYMHVDKPELSYGFIIDSSLRKIIAGDDFVYYCDLLVATNTRSTPNKDVLSRIISTDLDTLSMGSYSSAYQCSYCGKVSFEDSDNCYHINNMLHSDFDCDLGKSRVAYLACSKSDDTHKGFIEFYEQSWVENPAFSGSVGGYRVDIPEGNEIYFSMSAEQLNRSVDFMNGVRHWINKGFVEVVR